MLTNGQEKNFLYAEDCCVGLEQIYINFNKIKKLRNQLILQLENTPVLLT